MDADTAMAQASSTANLYATRATNHWMEVLHGDKWRQMSESKMSEAILQAAPLIAANITASATDFAAFVQHQRNEGMSYAREDMRDGTKESNEAKAAGRHQS